MTSIASKTDVQNAGNFSQKVSDATLDFYLEFTSFYMEMMLGSTTYAAAVAGTLTPAADVTKLKMSEALLTVSFALPAVGITVAEAGMLRTQAVGGRGGELEVVSFVKELKDLALHFATIGLNLIPETYVQSDKFKPVWFSVIQRVFPGLDEMPTMATIHSDAEATIQDARGDEEYTPGETG